MVAEVFVIRSIELMRGLLFVDRLYRPETNRDDEWSYDFVIITLVLRTTEGGSGIYFNDLHLGVEPF